MNTSDIWDAMGSLPEGETAHVLTRLFIHYETLLKQNPSDPEALHFFRSLDLAITQTCQCNSNRR